MLFCLVGAIAALLPILPGFVWCAKLMPLYPLLLLPLLIPASGMLLRKVPGGLTFLLLCLLPLAGALAALLGLTMFLVQGTPDGVLFRHGASLALWGYAAAALVIAIGSPNLKAEQEDFFPLPETDNPTAGENINLHIEIQDAERVLPPLEVEELPLDLELKYNDLSPLKENGFPETNYTAVPAGQDDATQVFPQADTAGQSNREVEGQGPSAFAENTASQQEITGEEADAPLAEPEIPVVRVIEITDEDEDWNEFDEDETDLTGQAEILSEPEPEPVADTLDLSFSAEADYSEEANPDFDYSAEAPHPGMELQPQGGNILANLEHIKTQQSKAENISDDLENILYGLGMALNNLDSAAHGNALDLPGQPDKPGQPNYPRMQSIFNLSSLVRAAHAETAALAESKGIALSWFVSPNLPLLYKGDEDSLKHALGYMLKGTVEYAESGVIQLTVREAPDHEEGLVQFSLTDNTMNPQSARRPAKILSRAWELARASQGSFSIDFLPNRGTSINFSLKLQPLQGEDNVWGSDKKAAGQIPETQPVSEDSFPDLSGIDLSKEEAAPIAEQQEPAKRQTSAEPDIDRIGVAVPGPELVVTPASIVDIDDFDELDLDLQENPTESTGEISGAVAGPVRDTIIVADLAASGRRLIARRLGELPHFRLEARNAAEIVQGCTWGNVCLIIFDADMPENDIKNALLEVNANEAKAGRPPVPSLGLLSHISQSSRMRKVGCTECQVKTASREKFQDMVLRLAPAQRQEETPLAEADAAIMTESPKAQADLQPKTLPKTLSDQTLDEQQQAPAQQDGPNLPDAQSGDLSDATAQAENRKKINTAKPDRSVPLLDLIVSTLDEEEEQDISALPNLEPLDPLDQATKLAEARAVARSAKKKLSIPDIMHNAVKEK
jgi:DNA-binding NarL/FixJ family response regulator